MPAQAKDLRLEYKDQHLDDDAKKLSSCQVQAGATIEMAYDHPMRAVPLGQARTYCDSRLNALRPLLRPFCFVGAGLGQSSVAKCRLHQ